MKLNLALISVFLAIFIDTLGVGILIPIFPLLLFHSTFRLLPDTWTISSEMILFGWLMATFSISQFLFTPLLGHLSDKFGRKRIIILSITGTGFSYFLCAVAIATKNIPLLFFSRITDGITGASLGLIKTVIADISYAENRAKNYSIIGLASGFGFVLGPMIGGTLSDYQLFKWFTPALPFYFAGVLSILNVILVIKFLPETLKLKKNSFININQSIKNMSAVLFMPGLGSIISSLFLLYFGYTFFTTFLSIVLVYKYNATQSDLGSYFAYNGIMIVLANFLVRKVAKYAIDYKILRFSIFCIAACILAYLVIPKNQTWLLFLISPFLAVFYALTTSFNSSLIVRITPVNIRGEVMGIVTSFISMANAIPLVIAGYIGSINLILPIIVGGSICLFSGICFWLYFKPNAFYYSERFQ